MASLQDVCKAQSSNIAQKDLENLSGNYPIYGASGLIKYVDFYKQDKPYIAVVKDGAGVGRVMKLPAQSSVIGTLQYILPNENIDIAYLFYVMEHMNLAKYYTGATIPHIYFKDYKAEQFHLATIKTQKKIASILQKIDSIISKRQQQLSKLDELVKTRFVEMFGDLVIGDKVSTNKYKIGDIASVTKLAGFEFTKYIQYQDQGDIIMLRGLNCKKGHLVLNDIKWIDKETSNLLPRSKLYSGDILMTYAGTIGDVALVDEDDKYHLAPNVAKITLDDKKAFNPVFLIHLFMYTNDYIMSFSSQVAQASINMQKIRDFEYSFPTTERQNIFATFVEQTDKQRTKVQQSLEKLKTLKKALMQKYFG